MVNITLSIPKYIQDYIKSKGLSPSKFLQNKVIEDIITEFNANKYLISEYTSGKQFCQGCKNSFEYSEFKQENKFQNINGVTYEIYELTCPNCKNKFLVNRK